MASRRPGPDSSPCFPFKPRPSRGCSPAACSPTIVARTRRNARLDLQCCGLAATVPFLVLFALRTGPMMACAGLVGFGLFRGIYDANIYVTLFDVIPPRLRASANGMMGTLEIPAGRLRSLPDGTGQTGFRIVPSSSFFWQCSMCWPAWQYSGREGNSLPAMTSAKRMSPPFSPSDVSP